VPPSSLHTTRRHNPEDFDPNLHRLESLKSPNTKFDSIPFSNFGDDNVWSYTSTPQYVFMVWCLVKHRDNFTFTLYADGHRDLQYMSIL